MGISFWIGLQLRSVVMRARSNIPYLIGVDFNNKDNYKAIQQIILIQRHLSARYLPKQLPFGKGEFS